nr:nucleolar protein 58-like [Ipomoea batatas]
MKTISGKVISTKPVSLSDAAVIISDFAATETGASDAVSVYIRRAADAFNQLVQFHHDLRYPNSGTKFLAKERVDYALKSSQNREIFVKQEGSVKKEAFVKTEPDSLATEENRKIKKYGAEKVKKEDKVKIEKGEEDGKYQENNYEKVKTEPEVDVVEGDSMKKKDKKNKKRKLSEGNEGEGGEDLVVETKKRKSEDIDGSAEQNKAIDGIWLCFHLLVGGSGQSRRLEGEPQITIH